MSMITAEARGAWHELERLLRPYLARRVASAADIDDALQEIFVKLHEALPGLRDNERFGPWVYRIANSVVVDRARTRARSPLLQVLSEQQAAAPALEEASADDLQADMSRCVASFVSQLASPYREAITLTELQGLSQKDAAELLGISLSGMKSRVQRGREKLRNMFEDCCRISVDCRGRVVECEPRELRPEPEIVSEIASRRSRC
jgi:RNA polymerase sigma-70 factor (ECF subfamily)